MSAGQAPGPVAGRTYKTKWCEFVNRKQGCRLGDQCRHAHSRDELREAPADYDPDAKRAWAVMTTESGWEDWRTYRVDGRADDPNPPPPTVYDDRQPNADVARALRATDRCTGRVSGGDCRMIKPAAPPQQCFPPSDPRVMPTTSHRCSCR